MIVVKIQEAAKSAGITTAYQLQKFSGFPPGMAARIFKGDWQRIDLSTLNTICNVLDCTPNDILEFVKDEEKH